MKAPVPTLSMLGWSRNPRESLDVLVSHFFLTNASQSDLYRGSMSTAQQILQKFSNDVVSAASEMSTALLMVLRKYYTDSSVSVTHRLIDPTVSASAVQFIVSGTVTDNGVSYQLNKLAEAREGIFVKFIETNNG